MGLSPVAATTPGRERTLQRLWGAPYCLLSSPDPLYSQGICKEPQGLPQPQGINLACPGLQAALATSPTRSSQLPAVGMGASRKDPPAAGESEAR